MKKLISLALFGNVLKTVRMEVLNGNKDEFHCYHIKQGEYLNQFLGQIDQFASHLQQTIQDCKEKKLKAIWIQLDKTQLSLAQKLIDQGFQMHHCTEDYLLFSQWLLNETNRLPNYTTHQVGAGGVIIKDNKLLLVQEKNGKKKGMWCIPGGLVDDGELIIEGAQREVLEETGLITEPYDCLFVRDLPIANDHNGDIYFAILMKLKHENQQVKVQEQEIGDHKWVDLNELKQFVANNNMGSTQQKLMNAIIEYNQSNRGQLFSIDTNPRMMYGKLKKYCLFKPNL